MSYDPFKSTEDEMKKSKFGTWFVNLFMAIALRKTSRPSASKPTKNPKGSKPSDPGNG